MAADKKKIIVIGGATASGKSAYALQLAKQNCGVIINGDSMQVYQAAPRLTAQPTEDEKCVVPHRLYYVLPVDEPCNVAKWHKMACDEIDLCHREGRVPLVVGGTGLYLDTLTQGLSYIPEIPLEIRQQVRELCHMLGTQNLHEKLNQLDPQSAAMLHPGDKQRITRAYEVLIGTGRPLRYWQQQKDTSRIKDYQVSKQFIDRPRAQLYQRASQRLEFMLKNGVIDEVKDLVAKPGYTNSPVMKAIGVPEITAYLNNELSYKALPERILLATRHYIKRQLTWFHRSFDDAEKVEL